MVVAVAIAVGCLAEAVELVEDPQVGFEEASFVEESFCFGSRTAVEAAAAANHYWIETDKEIKKTLHGEVDRWQRLAWKE